VRLVLVSRHHPRREGTAAGRSFLALGDALVAAGHEVTAYSIEPLQESEGTAPWCTPLVPPAEPALRVRARALVRPRWDLSRVDLPVPDDAVAMAEDPIAYAAIARARRAVVTFHSLIAIDARIRRLTPKDVQDIRNERRVARMAPLVLAFSQRVAVAAGHGAATVPIGYQAPDDPPPPVDDPVAMIMADWSWAPNQQALDRLLGLWPEVSRRVPDARLLVAGRGLDAGRRARAGGLGSVEVLGEVARSGDVLGRASVLAFPCPPSSGPKVKVIEALAYRRAVVTTGAGAEGLVVPAGEGLVVVDEDAFAETLSRLLADPAERARMGERGRAAVIAGHSPARAAEARIAAIAGRWPGG
jgi:glycosyltransferase involved in cell wall biosynthesis